MKSMKVGYVRLRPRGPGTFQADFRDPRSGRRTRVAIRVASEADAKRQARALSESIEAGRFAAPNVRHGAGPTVAEALRVAIEATGGTWQTRRDYTYLARGFVAWLETAAPAVRFWHGVTTEHVRAYALHLQRDTALSDRTVQGRLLMVRLASRYWNQSDPDRFRDVAHAVRVKARPGNPIEARAKELRKAIDGGGHGGVSGLSPETRATLARPCHAAMSVRSAREGSLGLA